jgi:hypothetical protein
LEAGLIAVDDLVDMFEAAEEATYDARQQAERDRDYHDNKQLTSQELATLRKRGQPPYVDNRIKTKVDYLVGLEKAQRVNPRALPRTPVHQDDADSASQALNYVADAEQFDFKRSAVWRNLLIEGAGGFAVAVEPRGAEVAIRLRRLPFDRMFWDPHSSELDFSDAGYLGTVQWLNRDDALALYADNPDAEDILDATLSSSPHLDSTYEDKPKFNVWADKKRKRVRVVCIWVKRHREWYFAEFTKAGILKAGPSPYTNDEGESDCELFFQSAYVDRDNNRFGLVREFISLQDAINKRNSKALHQLNTSQVVFMKGSVEDPEKARREAAKPDGMIEVLPAVSGGLQDHFQFNTRADLAQSQVALLQEAKQAIDLKGPNATAMGEKTNMGSASASGRAILASQQGGMISLGDLLDNLRHLDLRVFRAIWNRVRQYWTAEKWVRVTDDEQNVRWVGVNVDPGRLAMASPEQQQMIAGVIGNVAELDVDIIIDEAPDSVTPKLEQWQALVELAKAGIPVPPDELISAAPNLRNKQRILEKMREPNPMQQASTKLQLAGAQAEVQKTQAETRKIAAETAAMSGQGPSAVDQALKLMEFEGKAEDRRAAREKGQMEIAGKRLDLAGKAMALQQQRETPPPAAGV